MSKASQRLALLLAALAIVAASVWGLFYFRDDFSTHYPIKVLSAQLYRAGTIPLWNFYAGGGQPLGGNPNTLTFYPDNVLYLFLPAHVAFNLHFWLHLAAAFFALRLLCRVNGASESSARIAALLYTFGGVSISSLAFYNLVTAVALIPAALAVTTLLLNEPTLRRAVQLGALLGLLGLAVEPVTVLSVALAMIVLTLFAIRSLDLPRVAAATLGALAVALLIAAPQLLAYREIASEVERGQHAFSAQTVLNASLAPWRLLELFVGPFRGLITDLGPGSFQPAKGDWPPLFGSIFGGILLLPALFRRNAPRAWQAIAALALFFALGRFNPLVRAAVEASDSLRVARYPEKFVLVLAVALALLVARALDEVERWRVWTLAALVPLGVIALDLVRRGIGGLAVAAVAALAAFTLARLLDRRRLVLLALVFLPTFFWALRGIPLDTFAPYDRPAGVPPLTLGRGGRIARLDVRTPQIDGATSARDEYRMRAQRLDPTFGIAYGFRYALERSPEGMYSLLSRIVQERFTAAAPPLKMRWVRMLATNLFIGRNAAGNGIDATPVEGALPYVTVIRQPLPVRTLQEAVTAIERPDFDEQTTTVVPARVEGPASPARLTRISLAAQELSLDVDASGPAMLLVNESWFTAWTATVDGRPLWTFPANIDRLGIAVPAGRSTVLLRFGRFRQAIGAAWIVSSLLLLAAASTAMRRSRNAIAAPAR